MPVNAPGSIHSLVISGGRIIVAVFTINGVTCQLIGTFTSEIPTLNATNATLAYTSPNQLVGSWDYTGRIGGTIISLTFSNGSTLTGVLDEPVEPHMLVNGTGTWSGADSF